MTAACGRTIAAWGDGGVRLGRGDTIRDTLGNPLCLIKRGKILTDRGQPFYPRAIATPAAAVPLP